MFPYFFPPKHKWPLTRNFAGKGTFSLKKNHPPTLFFPELYFFSCLVHALVVVVGNLQEKKGARPPVMVFLPLS